jgi:hypothetical protein
MLNVSIDPKPQLILNDAVSVDSIRQRELDFEHQRVAMVRDHAHTWPTDDAHVCLLVHSRPALHLLPCRSE